MFFTFILGALAGWATPKAEPRVRDLLTQALPTDDIEGVEMRGITLALLLFAAAAVSVLIAQPSALSLTFGAVVGVLGTRVYERVRAMRAPDYDS